jgi:hypothetical protein
MDPGIERLTQSRGRQPSAFAGRCLWIAARLVAAIYLGQAGGTFFYQNF